MNLSQEEQNRCEEFLSAFNEVECHLRQALNENEQTDFKRLIDQYIDRYSSWLNNRLKLRNLADLRNVLVHQRTQPYQYPAVPSDKTIAETKQFRDRLINPQKAFPTFKRDVEMLNPSQSLAWTFQLINQCDYSQFPVYESERFLGLLTENGITRWLAHHTVTELTIVDCEAIFISQLLPEEESRANYTFVSRNSLVDEVIEQFSNNLFLEAALVTDSGKQNGKLLGIATRWDILKCLQERK